MVSGSLALKSILSSILLRISSRQIETGFVIMELRPMEVALALANSQLGQVSPLPAVGALVLSNGMIVGQAATEASPGLHAERGALEAAGEQARDADLYVTLEPCNHYGLTPPCTKAIIKAGISRVFIAVRDPNPASQGGREELLEAGIDVVMGDGMDVATDMYQGFFKTVEQKRPYVTVKWAMSRDGFLARLDGERLQISGKESLHRVQELRRQTDAILVGSGTALADDPMLTCRLADYHGRQPLRVVLDRQLRMRATAAMLARDVPGETLIVTGPESCHRRSSELQRSGAEIVKFPSKPRQQLDALLDELGQRGVINLLVEGGAAVSNSILMSGLADRLEVFVAPFELTTGVPAPITTSNEAGFRRATGSSAVSLRDSGEDTQITVILNTYGPRPGY